MNRSRNGLGDASAPSYTLGAMFGEVSSAWVAESKDANLSSTETTAVISDYCYLFNGLIENFIPNAHEKAIELKTRVECVDFVEVMRLTGFSQPLAKSQTSDQINTTLLSALPIGAIPGKLQDTGKVTHDNAFNGYTETDTHITDALMDSAISEFGRSWVDRDGTFRFVNREFIARQTNAAPALTLSDREAFKLTVIRALDYITNDVTITWHPRNIISTDGFVVIGKLTDPVQIPPIGPSGPGVKEVTPTFIDTNSGTIIGGDTLQALTPMTDYVIKNGVVVWISRPTRS